MMSKVCDQNLIFELVSDLSEALKNKSEIEIYRYLNVLTNYLKGKTCPKETIERAIKILESLHPDLSEDRRIILKEVIEAINKAVKSKKKTKKPKKGRSRRRRRR